MTVLDLSLVELAAALLIVGVASSFQSSIGFGFNILAVPVLALIDPDLTPIPTMVMGIPLTFLTWQRERADVDYASMRWIILGRLPGSFIGAALLAAVSRRFLDGFIAAVVLIAVVIIASGYTIRRTAGTKFAIGLTSGITGASSAIGGPPLALLYHRDRGPVLRSSLAFVFFIGQFVNLTALGVNGELSWRPVQLAFVLMPAMFLGYRSSGYFTTRVEGRPQRIAVLATSALAGLALGTRTLFG